MDAVVDRIIDHLKLTRSPRARSFIRSFFGRPARLLDQSGPRGYFFAFLFAGLVHIVALLAIHIIMPRMTPLGEDLKRVPTE